MERESDAERGGERWGASGTAAAGWQQLNGSERAALARPSIRSWTIAGISCTQRPSRRRSPRLTPPPPVRVRGADVRRNWISVCPDDRRPAASDAARSLPAGFIIGRRLGDGPRRRAAKSGDRTRANTRRRASLKRNVAGFLHAPHQCRVSPLIVWCRNRHGHWLGSLVGWVELVK